MSQQSDTKDHLKKRTACESMDEKITKRQKRNRVEAPKILSETLAKWIEYNKDEKAIKCKTPANGSKKGCMKGKGGPENSKCSFRGVRQRTWDVTGYCNEDGLCQGFPEYDMFDLDELLSVMDQRSEYSNENKPYFSENTLNKSAATYDSAATCSYSETSEVQDLKSRLPAQSVYEESEVVNEPLVMRKEKNFDVYFVEAGRPEECSFSLEELGLTWEPTELVL
nr:hypothetical protein [Tanacetum cinerariifolium]